MVIFLTGFEISGSTGPGDKFVILPNYLSEVEQHLKRKAVFSEESLSLFLIGASSCLTYLLIYPQKGSIETERKGANRPKGLFRQASSERLDLIALLYKIKDFILL